MHISHHNDWYMLVAECRAEYHNGKRSTILTVFTAISTFTLKVNDDNCKKEASQSVTSLQVREGILSYSEYMKIRKGLCHTKLSDYCSLLYILVMRVVRAEKSVAVNFGDAKNGSHF